MFAHFDLLTVGVLVPGDLHEGLGLGDALLLHIDPAEVLGDGLQHPGALDVGVVVAVVEVAVTGRDLSLTVFTLESKYLLVLREKLEIFVKMLRENSWRRQRPERRRGGAWRWSW